MINRVSYPNITVCLLFIIYVVGGFFTVPVVIHWDESKLIDSVISQYQQGELLPQWYNYPSVIFYISYFNYFVWEHLFSMLISNFNHFNRWIFYIICGVPFLIIYRHYCLKNSHWQAIIPSLLWFASWEFHYHSRWVAPDALMASFGMITIILLIKKNDSNWWTATIFAALAMGSKYTGGIFLIPILIRHTNESLKHLMIKWGKIIILFSIIFLITTPGLIFDTTRCLNDIRYEQQHYATGHYNYTINKGVWHFVAMIKYISLMSSPWFFLNLFILLISILGIGIMIWTKKYKMVAYLTVTLVLYLLFMSNQRVMFARNILISWPFIVLFSSYAIHKLLTNSKWFFKSIYATLIIVSVFAVVYKDVSIWAFNSEYQILEVAKYINYRPENKYLISKEVYEELVIHNIKLSNSVNTSDKIFYVFFLYEAQQRKLPSNESDWITKDFGPGDVNLNYYPTWQNNHRVVIVNVDRLSNIAGVQFIDLM